MTLSIEKHPCFNDASRHSFGRIHLPVAPKCNIQCNYCNRKFDCLNENRPGVTSRVLSPHQALHYLDQALELSPNIAVVGIAGPGDPFANPEETMATLRLVREKYPEMLLCVATNGLNVLPYIEELAELKVSHVTLTINAIDPEIGAEIYAWVRHGKKVFRDVAGAELLLKNQLEALKKLKELG
ncbi:MAG: radical SAM protein, partial [Ignavibacteriaceae bacterium]|nr:radical SAM protein [Ignavibacteriaceae bacterium]